MSQKRSIDDVNLEIWELTKRAKQLTTAYKNRDEAHKNLAEAEKELADAAKAFVEANDISEESSPSEPFSVVLSQVEEPKGEPEDKKPVALWVHSGKEFRPENINKEVTIDMTTDNNSCIFQKKLKKIDGTMGVRIDGLDPQKQYHFRAKITNDWSEVCVDKIDAKFAEPN